MTTILNQNTGYTPNPDGGGGAAIVFLGGVGLLAYFWEFFAWVFGGIYSGISTAFTAVWTGGTYVLENAWTIVSSILTSVWGAFGTAIVWTWQTISISVIEFWSAIALVAVLIWTTISYVFILPGWPIAIFWDMFGIYMLFGIATGIIIGLLRYWLNRRSRVLEEIVQSVGSPDVVTASRLGIAGVLNNVATSLALAGALAFVGLVVPYVIAGLQSPILPESPLELGLIVSGGFGGFGPGGGFGGGLLDIIVLLLALCIMILVLGALVGILVSGGLSLTSTGLTKLIGPAISTISPMAGQYIGQVVGVNLALALTGKRDDDGDNSHVLVVRKGFLTGLIVALFFVVWLAIVGLLTS